MTEILQAAAGNPIFWMAASPFIILFFVGLFQMFGEHRQNNGRR